MIRDMTNFADLKIGDAYGNYVNEEEQEEDQEEDNDDNDDDDMNGADMKCYRACDRNVLRLLLFPGGETTS